MDMTVSGVPRLAQCVLAPEGAYPAALAPARISPVPGIKACSPQPGSVAPSVPAMESLALGRGSFTGMERSGSPASVPDVSAAMERSSAQ